MFRRPWFWSATVISDEGFSVRLKTRGSIVYSEGGREMTISTEGGGKFIDVFHSTIKHWDGEPHSVIDAKTDKRIVDNLTDALEWCGFSVQIVT